MPNEVVQDGGGGVCWREGANGRVECVGAESRNVPDRSPELASSGSLCRDRRERLLTRDSTSTTSNSELPELCASAADTV